MPTATEKERALEAIRTLPESATIDEAIERLCLIAKIEEGFRQSDAGQVVSHEEVKKRFLA
jgi:predicted transcriptional regulator